MDDEIIDNIEFEKTESIETDSSEVLPKKHHNQARLILHFFLILTFLNLIITAEYGSLEEVDIIELAIKVLFLGFMFHYNNRQLQSEKEENLPIYKFPPWHTSFFLIGLLILLVLTIYLFIETIKLDWFKLGTILLLTTIIAIISLFILEVKYLKK